MKRCLWGRRGPTARPGATTPALLLALGAILLGSGQAAGRSPYIVLGPQQAFSDQPYVTIELFKEDPLHPGQYLSLGPDGAGGLFGTPYNYFLLDTGANGILAVDAAATSLASHGYQIEAEFIEYGVAGPMVYDVSAPYRVGFTGSDGLTHYLPLTADGVRIQSSPDAQLGGPVDWGGIAGLIGMPAMVNRVTTLDFSQWSFAEDILDMDPMGVTFSDALPAGGGHRYAVRVDKRIAFSAADGRPDWEEPDSPLPTYADVPFMTATAAHHDALGGPVERSGTFLLDTGAQFSLLSRSMAFRLGMDANGDGNLDDDAIDFLEIGGVGGTRNVPVMLLDEFRLPTQEGVDLVWKPTDPEDLGLQFLVLDILPCGDVDGNGIVTSADAAIVQENWGRTVPAGDLPSGDVTGDGRIDQDDLDLVQSQLGQSLFIDGVFGADLLTGGIMINLGDLSIEGDPFFQKVHFDFRDMDEGSGAIVFDLSAVYDHVQYPVVPGDANGDGKVDDLDASILAANWQRAGGATWAQADFNGDGMVNDLDASILASHWQEGVGAGAVPEPSTIALLIAGLTCLLFRRRRSIATHHAACGFATSAVTRPIAPCGGGGGCLSSGGGSTSTG